MTTRPLIFALVCAGAALAMSACATPEEIIDKAMAFNERLAGLAVKHKDDCKKMAAEVRAAFEAEKATLAKAKKLKKELDPKRLRAIAKKHLPRIQAYASKMIHLNKCAAEQPDLMKVFAFLR